MPSYIYRLGDECTEVLRAPLINFQKTFFNKVFIKIKIARKFKFCIWMIISGSKSVKRSQKILKKATIWTYTWFFEKKIALANLIHINSYNMRKKSVMSLYKFRTYFFPLSEFETSFLNLLTRANNTRPCFFWLTFIKLYWGQSTKGLLGVVRWPFYVVKIKK